MINALQLHCNLYVGRLVFSLMSKIRYLKILFDKNIQAYEVSQFRGAVIAKTKGMSNLFHNHLDDKEFIYRYPLIQYKIHLLIIATRKEDTREHINKHIKLTIASARKSSELGKCRVVGVDLAGHEHEKTRASYYEADFEPIHRAGISLTIHAGENDQSEGIWQAVYKLNTRRIGHGLFLLESPELLNAVVDRGIGVEMCPYANFQIKGFKPMTGMPDYPLKTYLDHGVQVCVNTDNIGISKASITDNFMLLTKLNPELTRIDVLQLIRNGIEQAFISPQTRMTILKMMNKSVFDLCQ